MEGPYDRIEDEMGEVKGEKPADGGEDDVDDCDVIHMLIGNATGKRHVFF